MAAKHTKRKKSRKSVILRICIIAFTFYAAVMLVDMQVTLSERRQDLDELKQAYENQRLENKELERQLDMEMDDEYIERIARDKLDYVYPDERVFVDISGS